MVKNRGGENGMIFPGEENGISQLILIVQVWYCLVEDFIPKKREIFEFLDQIILFLVENGPNRRKFEVPFSTTNKMILFKAQITQIFWDPLE